MWPGVLKSALKICTGKLLKANGKLQCLFVFSFFSLFIIIEQNYSSAEFISKTWEPSERDVQTGCAINKPRDQTKIFARKEN